MSAQQSHREQPEQKPQKVQKALPAGKNYVKKDGVLKEQVQSEELAKVSWNHKWAFMKDYYKICLEEAAKEGISEEQLCKMRITKTGYISTQVPDTWQPVSSEKFSVTSSGVVGWRSSRQECTLERFGSLYISPRHTISLPDRPQTPPQNCIILG